MKKKPGRRSFSREFKLEAVRQIIEQNRTIAEVSRELGIGAGQVGRWKQQFLTDREDAFPGNGRLKVADEEVRRLERELEDRLFLQLIRATQRAMRQCYGSPRMTRKLRALGMAVKSRRPGSGLIFHSDRGSTYAATAFTDELKRLGMRASMSRKGDCWDNAVAESFFSSLKAEWMPEDGYETVSDGMADLFR